MCQPRAHSGPACSLCWAPICNFGVGMLITFQRQSRNAGDLRKGHLSGFNFHLYSPGQTVIPSRGDSGVGAPACGSKPTSSLPLAHVVMDAVFIISEIREPHCFVGPVISGFFLADPETKAHPVPHTRLSRVWACRSGPWAGSARGEGEPAPQGKSSALTQCDPHSDTCWGRRCRGAVSVSVASGPAWELPFVLLGPQAPRSSFHPSPDSLSVVPSGRPWWAPPPHCRGGVPRGPLRYDLGRPRPPCLSDPSRLHGDGEAPASPVRCTCGGPAA